jgi:signal peptidase II
MKSEILFATTLFFADRIIKYFLCVELIKVPIDYGFFTLVLEKNTGFALGFLNNIGVMSSGAHFFIYGIAYVVTFTAARHIFGRDKFVSGMLCIWIGAISNFIDRILYGGVLDYIAITVYGFDLPIFNIADLLIVCGTAVFYSAYWKKS